MANKADLKVFISSRESVCDECHNSLGRSAWIVLVKDKGAICLSCADLDHLVFLPSGDAALTRRARKHSTLSAVVLKWSRARKHYERQGLLVEEAALETAEQECLADGDVRERRRQRAAIKRMDVDQQYIKEFAGQLRNYFPRCPKGRERAIAEHACLKYSGRVGRSKDAKSFDKDAIQMAVIAHIRHRETEYDTLLAQGYERYDARAAVRGEVDSVFVKWSAPIE